MKKRILSIIIAVCLLVGTVPAITVGAEGTPIIVSAFHRIFGDSHVICEEYGAIYFTLAPADCIDGYHYLNSEPVYSNEKIEDVLKSLNEGLYGSKKAQSINFVLTHDWETDSFPTNKTANINIDLNGYTWKVNNCDGLQPENKNITISGGTMIIDCRYSSAFTMRGGNISVRNVTFKDCHAPFGGLIHLENYKDKVGTVNLDNVTFDNCTCGGRTGETGIYQFCGSCVYIDAKGSKENYINNCQFINCSTHWGGAVYINSNETDVHFVSSKFIDCKAKKDGGAIYVNGNNCDLQFNSCYAFNCHSNNSGGFLFIKGEHTNINGFGDKKTSSIGERSVISNCSSGEYGGAIYTSDAANHGHYADIKNFVFSANTAGSDKHEKHKKNYWGGALCICSQYVNISYCDFYDNIAGYYGGAVYIADNHDEISNCTFENNYSDPKYYGEDVYVDDNDITIKNNTFYTDYPEKETLYQHYKATTSGNTFYIGDKCISDKFDGGDGSKANPYKIKTAEQLRTLARNVKYGKNYSGKYFVLTADIKNVCAPIGFYTKDKQYFAGHFDGQGHSVTLAIHALSGDLGLFAHTKGAEIKNICIKGYVSGATVSGVVSHAENTVISGCTNEAELSNPGHDYAGGIVGWIGGNSVIYQCKNTATVKGGHDRAGGIAGYAENTKIVGCYNFGVVSADNYDAGGIVGYTTGALFVKSCTNDAPVCAYMSAAGIVGTSYGETNVLNCNNTANGKITTHAHSGGILGWCDATKTKTVNGKKQFMTKKIYNCANYGDMTVISDLGWETSTGAGGIIGQVSKKASDTDGVPAEICCCVSNCKTPEIYISGQITGTENPIKFSECYIGSKNKHSWENYPALTDEQFGQELVDKLNITVNSKNGDATVNEQNDLTYYTEPKKGDWMLWKVDAVTKKAIPFTSKEFISTTRQELDGKGTKDNPYTASTNTQLQTLQADIEAGNDFSGCHFKLNKNINYTGEPLGSEAHPFSGIFDGAGFAVMIDIDSSAADGSALFGCIKNGTVKNLIVNGRIICNNYGAGIVAKAVGEVTVENCLSDLVSITSNMYSAGICAYSEGTLSVKNCRNNSKVFGNDAAAGIIADVAKGDAVVVNTINLGAVSAFSIAGGIIGTSNADTLKVYNSANYASVSASSETAIIGGIAGKTANIDMITCLNTAKLQNLASVPDAYSGALIGFTDNINNLDTCYYLSTSTAFPDYNTDNADIDRKAIKGTRFSPKILKSKFNDAALNEKSIEEKTKYGFTVWEKSTATTASDLTYNMPIPESFTESLPSEDAISGVGSVFTSSDITMIVILLVISAVLITAVLVYKKKRKNVTVED